MTRLFLRIIFFIILGTIGFVYIIKGLEFLIPIVNENADGLGLIIFIIYLAGGYYLYKFIPKILDNLLEKLEGNKNVSTQEMSKAKSRKNKKFKYNLTDSNQVVKIINDFGNCIINYKDAGLAFYDTKYLPHPKMTIAKALVLGTKLSKKKKEKEEMVSSLLTILPSFQDNVGEAKISIAGFNMDMSIEELNKTDFEEYKKILEKKLNESKINEKKLKKLREKFDEDVEKFKYLLDASKN